MTGRVTGTLRVGAPDPIGDAVGIYLADGPSKDSIFVLAPYAGGSRQAVVQVAIRPLKIVPRYPLPQGTVFRSVQTSPHSRRLYAVGNEGAQQHVGAPVLANLDAASGRVLRQQTLRPASGRQWLVFDTAISNDGRLLFVSYHGQDTTGADWVSASTAPSAVAPTAPQHRLPAPLFTAMSPSAITT